MSVPFCKTEASRRGRELAMTFEDGGDMDALAQPPVSLDDPADYQGR